MIDLLNLLYNCAVNSFLAYIFFTFGHGNKYQQKSTSGQKKRAQFLGKTDFREGNVESHQCGKCEKEFSEAENLQDHMRQHENQCEVCSKEFDNAWALKFHNQAMHSFARI